LAALISHWRNAVGWFEDRAKRKQRVVTLPTPETYYKRFDLYLTLEGYWELMLSQYKRFEEPYPHYRCMTFSEYLSYDWYEVLKDKPKWTDEDYERTRLYRLWKAAYETAYEQAEYAKYRSDLKPVIVWPDRRRHMVRTYKKTGE
jgi:hypothetical protein